MKIKMIALLIALAVSGNAANAVAGQSGKAGKYKFSDIAHLSCKDAWHQADKSVDKAFAMIETLTVYLLKQRQQQFPDNQESGNQFGKSIDTRCKADPDQLMLSAVDAALREVVK